MAKVKESHWVPKLRQLSKKVITRDERLNETLADMLITWLFNMSEAPWWGGQFERIIGLKKNAMYKVLGKAHRKFDELKEVLLEFDLDHNGQLTSKEIGAAFKKLGHNLPEDELRKIIKEVDTNKNGTIDFDEFVEIYKSSVVVVGPSGSKESVQKRDEK
eukprot:gene5030-5688_t